jgi:hypothetical protein
MPRANKWFNLRLSIVAVFAAGAMSFPEDIDAMPWFIAPLPFFFFLIVPFIQSWICLTRRGSRYKWRTPSWYESPFTNPFRHTEPLRFFHLGAFCFMSFGLVWLVSKSWDWSRGIPLPLFPFSAGLGLWAYVHLFSLVFAKKFQQQNH